MGIFSSAPLLFSLSCFFLLFVQTTSRHPEQKSYASFHGKKPLTDSNYRLPSYIRPVKYELNLYLHPVDYDLEGQVIITLNVTEKNTTILYLNIDADYISGEIPITLNENETCELTSFMSDMIEITCPNDLYGTNQTLKINYQSLYARDDMLGVYTSNYLENAVQRTIIATQLEQGYARRFFPCFDEPEFKAPIQLTINHTAAFDHWASNTDVSSSVVDGDIIMTTFEYTPKMSTYLLAFVLTEDYQNFTDQSLTADYEFNIFARPSADGYLQVALENGPKLIDLLGSYLGIPYPSLGNKKMTFAAIPEFRAGAMENWGLITFRESILKDEAGRTTEIDKQNIIAVIAHELAHQWFGDYVTLDWWSEAWLNEGFAQFFEYNIAEQLGLKYEYLSQFIVLEKQTVLKDDAYPNALPLSNNESNVNSESDFHAEFGDITYYKGACIITMLQYALGETNFQKGLQTYLKTNQYSNPSAKDLLSALQSQVPKDQNLDLATNFDSWIYKQGYPIVSVSLELVNKTNYTISIRADKFSSSLNKTGEDLSSDWWLPLSYTTSEKPDFKTIQFLWIDPKNVSDFTLSLPDNNSWAIFNLQSSGYYRVNYDQNLWTKIISVLNNTDTVNDIHVLNRAQLLDDAFNVAKSTEPEDENRNMPYLTAFTLAKYLTNEQEYYPWYTFFSEMEFLLERIEDEDTVNNLKKTILDLASNSVIIPTQETAIKVAHIETLRRNLLLKWACRLGHQKCIDYAQQQFELYKKNASSINNNYRDVIICTGLANSKNSTEDFNIVLNNLYQSNLPYEQLALLESLACVNEITLLDRYLKETINFDTKLERRYFDKIFQFVYSASPDATTVALKFLINNVQDILMYYQYITTPEEMLAGLSSKIFRQEQIELIQAINDTNLGQGVINSVLKTANETLAWMQKYSYILTSVIVYHGGKSTTAAPTTTTTPPKTTIEPNVTSTIAPNGTTTIAPNGTTTIAPNGTTTSAPNGTTTEVPNTTTASDAQGLYRMLSNVAIMVISVLTVLVKQM